MGRIKTETEIEAKTETAATDLEGGAARTADTTTGTGAGKDGLADIDTKTTIDSTEEETISGPIRATMEDPTTTTTMARLNRSRDMTTTTTNANRITIDTTAAMEDGMAAGAQGTTDAIKSDLLGLGDG